VNIGVKQDEYIEEATAYVLKALDFDTESSEAHLVLGNLLIALEGRMEEGWRHLQRALALSPNDPDALMWTVVCCSIVGRMSEAYPLVERLRQVDPLTPLSRWFPLYAQVFDGHFDPTSENLTAFVRQDPEHPIALMCGMLFLAYAGRFDEARTLVEEHTDLESTEAFNVLALLLKHALEEERGKMTELLRDEFVKTASSRPAVLVLRGFVFRPRWDERAGHGRDRERAGPRILQLSIRRVEGSSAEQPP